MVNLKIDLPNSFFQEEERSGYLVKAEIKELWAVQLDLLSEFDRVCKKYDLKYILDFGTLLGAVRHNGFIPWDDDLDVSMLREDYDKLMKIGPKEFTHPYFLQNHYTDKGYDLSVAKLRRSDTTLIEIENLKHKSQYNHGIFIDIFVWDNIPTNDLKELEVLNQKLFGAYSHLYVMKHRPSLNDRIKLPLTLLRYLFYKLLYGSSEKEYRRLYAMATQFSKSDYVANLMYLKSECRLRKWHEDLTEIAFEGMMFPVPADYDELLTDCYGDYMVPVRGASDHTIVYFDANRPYKEVIKERGYKLKNYIKS